MKQKIQAYIKGLIEFRSNETTHYDNDLIEYYDAGRDMGHHLTLRYYDC